MTTTYRREPVQLPAETIARLEWLTADVSRLACIDAPNRLAVAAGMLAECATGIRRAAEVRAAAVRSERRAAGL